MSSLVHNLAVLRLGAPAVGVVLLEAGLNLSGLQNRALGLSLLGILGAWLLVALAIWYRRNVLGIGREVVTYGGTVLGYGTGLISHPIHAFSSVGDVLMDHLSRSPKAITEASRNIDLNIRFAQCCKPKPGEQILGIVTTRGISVHNKACRRIENGTSHQCQVKTNWPKGIALRQVLVRIETSDRAGFIHELTGPFSERGINIGDIIAVESPGEDRTIDLTIKGPDIDQLDELIPELEKMEGVQSITRTPLNLGSS